MKTLSLLLPITALMAMSFNVPDTTLTGAERKYASDLLQKTKDDLLKKVKGLSAEQLSFKADANSWSVAECMEHIALAEKDLFELAQNRLERTR